MLFRGGVSHGLGLMSSSRILISVGVSAVSAGASGAVRLSMVSQKIRQLTIQYTAIKLARRSAVRSLDSSALQPDLRILWKVSIFHRSAYHWSFSMAATRESTGRLVMSF